MKEGDELFTFTFQHVSINSMLTRYPYCLKNYLHSNMYLLIQCNY
ncbi:hypothetical protein BACPEC_01861 [[Bacteroides] pectinophilus ATCC 43243]|uniref:Uncharacterized protein n=1 Tax=[Bacteroides] pectinophilus ATCC 43243 TaxID=483218 RepID=B7AS07_9FIRM|nr:hypothetical protein BACPEC_01861 [[Bacteroides] pectinophilus ATCC 43243]